MKRDIQIDNTKVLLIILVVIGHLLQPTLLRENPSLWPISKPIYLLIYLFHMPLFVIISGYYSSSDGSSANVFKNVMRTFLPYLIFQFLNQTFNYWFTFDSAELACFNPFHPAHMMWYLLCMFIWRLILPFINQLKHPILLSMVISILSGYWSNNTNILCVSQMLSFFPFFLIGFYLKSNNLMNKIVMRLPVWMAIFILLCAAIFSILIQPRFAFWLWRAYDYADMGFTQWYAGIYRLAIDGGCLILAFAFLRLIPKRKMFFSQIGALTLYIYLLHSLLIRYLLTVDFFSTINSLTGFLFLLVIAILFTAFASLGIVRKIALPFVEPLLFYQYCRDFLTVYSSSRKIHLNIESDMPYLKK